MKSKAKCVTQDAEQASKWVKQGKLLAYPTESVWGIGCDPYNQNAVEQILAIKKRPIEKGMIVVTDSIDSIEPLLTNLEDNRRQEIIDSWLEPESKKETLKNQATTWVLPLAKHDNGSSDLRASSVLNKHNSHLNLPIWITGKHNSVAVRVINHPMIREVCHNLKSEDNPYGFIVSTSCNPSQLSPATTYDEAYQYFTDGICYLLGETLGYSLPSQIKDAKTGTTIR